MSLKKYIQPALWVIAFQVIAAIIGSTTASNMDWYNGLQKSELTPPDIAFPIVWTCLYVMLALAAHLVWKDYRAKGLSLVFILFWAQMLMNWGWSYVFFEFQMVKEAYLWICALNALMLCYIILQWSSNKTAALLVLPTLVWGCFAAYLNYQIMMMNGFL